MARSATNPRPRCSIASTPPARRCRKRPENLLSGEGALGSGSARLWLYEQSIYARSHTVVALNDYDVRPFPWLNRFVIAPIFGKATKSWSGENGCLFFVGNLAQPSSHRVAVPQVRS